MLGSLAKWLRIFGYDVKYAKKKNDTAGLIIDSLRESRVLLTRNQSLSRKRAWKLVLLRSDKLPEQLKQVINETGIKISKERLFTRCSACNSSIEPVKDKSEIKEHVPEYIHSSLNEFSRCSGCKKIYWKGTHWELLLNDLKKAGIKIE
jgi:uncharacterized protein with PIN domain